MLLILLIFTIVTIALKYVTTILVIIFISDDEILPYLQELLDRCDESEVDISDGDDLSESANTSAIVTLPLLHNENESDSEESQEECEVTYL